MGLLWQRAQKPTLFPSHWRVVNFIAFHFYFIFCARFNAYMCNKKFIYLITYILEINYNVILQKISKTINLNLYLKVELPSSSCAFQTSKMLGQIHGFHPFFFVHTWMIYIMYQWIHMEPFCNVTTFFGGKKNIMSRYVKKILCTIFLIIFDKLLYLFVES